MNHQDLVERIKAQLEAQGVDLQGPCGGFQITSRVAWTLRGERAGLLDKPAGNNCAGYAVDIICYPTGEIIDCLGDAGGDNRPLWNDAGTVDPQRWREPFPPLDAPTPEPPAPPPDALIALADAFKQAGLSLLRAADLIRVGRV